MDRETVSLRMRELAKLPRRPRRELLLVCDYCGHTFGGFRADARYCSSAHKQAAYLDRKRRRATPAAEVNE